MRLYSCPSRLTAARAGRIKWRYHALLRAYQRGITREQALQIINTGEIIEQRLRARPFPKCLLMATVEPDRPLYVSVGYDPEPRGARAQEAPGSILRGSAIFDSPPSDGLAPAFGGTGGNSYRLKDKLKAERVKPVEATTT